MSSLITSAHARVTPAISGFWRWWTGELRELLPMSLTAVLPGKWATAQITSDRSRVELIRIANGEGERLVESKPITAFDAENWAEISALTAGYRARIILKPPLVHVLTLDLPKAARTRLSSAIPLQLRNHAPVLPELLRWAILDTRLDGERLTTRVAIVRATTLEDIARGFHDRGLAVPAVLVECEDMRPTMLRPAEAMAGGFGLGRPWTIAAALLLSTPLWIWLTLFLLGQREQAQADALGQLAGPRLAAERKLGEIAQAGQALKALLTIPPVTDAVEDLARRVPANAHAIEVARRDNGSLTFALEASDPDALRPALAGDRPLSGLREVGQVQSPSGTIRIQYETAAP